MSHQAHRAQTPEELDESFDAFYASTRRGLLLETLALTGDRSAGQSAVREVYASAWRRWRRLSRLDDPLTWVRPRVWRLAQRRHAARPYHRPRRLPHEQRRVLRAIAQLPVPQRRLLVAVDVAGLDLSTAVDELGLRGRADRGCRVGRRSSACMSAADEGGGPEAGRLRSRCSGACWGGAPPAFALSARPLTAESAEMLLHRARATVAVALAGTFEGLNPQRAVTDAVTVLGGVLEGATLSRGSQLRRVGRRQRRTRVVTVAAVASLLAVGGGTLAHEPDDAASAFHLDKPSASATPEAASKKLPTGDDLLDATQIRRLAPRRSWWTARTTNNTSGDGINSVCQRTRFADPKGYAALVRKFRTRGNGRAWAVQTVEASRSTAGGRRTFDTTLGWWAGCRAPRVQVVGAYRVHGVGDESIILVLRRWRTRLTTISVGVARAGPLVTSTVITTPGTSAPSARRLTRILAHGVSSLCARMGATGCVHRASARAVPPPPSGEGRGLLAVDDLPPAGGIHRPWAGTRPITPRRNPGATTCDHAAFASAGARQRRSRTYVVPRAKVPARFGLTETYGRFRSNKAAARFLAHIRSHVAGCEKRDLAAKVGGSRTWHARHADLSRWDLTLAVSDKEKVRLRIAFVRVGDRVSELTFVPAEHGDIAPRAFDALMVRAGQRLREVP